MTIFCIQNRYTSIKFMVTMKAAAVGCMFVEEVTLLGDGRSKLGFTCPAPRRH